MGIRESEFAIKNEYGESALVLAKTLVTAFAEGMLKDKREGRARSIEDNTVEMESRERVGKALKELINEQNNLDYQSSLGILRYRDKSDKMVTFVVRDLEKKSLATLIYRLMEDWHRQTMDKQTDVYVDRDLYDRSLETAIFSMAFIK